MPDSSVIGTRERLLDAAERLLAEHGLAETSVRMITEKAEANVAAVNYHFGSKDDLVKAVFMRRLREIDDMRMQRLDALEVGGRQPDVEEITRAFMEPLVVQGISRETGKLVPFVVLIRQVFSDPESGQRSCIPGSHPKLSCASQKLWPKQRKATSQADHAPSF